MDASREIRVVQDAREWPLLPNGEHPKLEEIRDAYQELPKGHPKLTLLWAAKSDFGYWLWLPRSKNYYGSTPKKGMSARVEKVRHNGKEIKIIGYGTKVGEIHGWYNYDEVMSFFSLYFEPEQKKLCFPNTEHFINKLEKGVWRKYQHPGMPDGENGPTNEETEEDQDQYQDQYVGRGRASNRRGRGQGQGRGSQGHGRGNNSYYYSNYRGNRWGRY